MNTSSPKPPSAKPGWYELTSESDIERYWDGFQWTENVRVKKSKLFLRRFSPLNNHFLWKWYVLALSSVIVGTFIVLGLGSVSKFSSSSNITNSSSVKATCVEILSFDWYKLNTREFAKTPDISGRKSNSLLIEKYFSQVDEYQNVDPVFWETIQNLYRNLDEVASTGHWDEAAKAAAEADKDFKKFAEFCSTYEVDFAAPVISEATENTSDLDTSAQARVPKDYSDNGEGIAFKLQPLEECGAGQYGCTGLEIYSYKTCTKGVKIYANLFDSGGREVATTDMRTEPLKPGQSSAVILSTGLSSAVSATPNLFICE